MRGRVAKGLRKELANRLAGMEAQMETMYHQDPRTQVIKRTSTCFRSLYQKAKRNYNKAMRG